MANVLESIPGLGGYLAMQDYRQRQALGGLQGAVGLLQAVQQHEKQQREAEMAPLQRQALEAQVGELQRKAQTAREIDTAIGALTPEQRTLARLAPQQFVAGLTRNPYEGATEIEKLHAYQKRLREAGKTAEADQVAAVITNKEAGGTSFGERAFRTLQTLQMKLESGQQLTPEETAQAESARAMLSRSEMRIDPVTKEPYWAQPIQIPPRFTVGMPSGAPAQPGAPGENQTRPGPVNALPSVSQGRAPLDSASEKELNIMGDARAIASDLQKSFQDEFGGFGSDILANAVNEFGRRFADDGSKKQRMAQFWEAYEQWITDMRKEKFGATLTGNELQQFDRLRAKPSQSPAQIKNNLQRQMQLVEQSMGRRMTSLARQGVNQSAIEGAVGWGVQRPSVVSPQLPQKEIKRTGTLNGKRVIEYADGSVEVQ